MIVELLAIAISVGSFAVALSGERFFAGLAVLQGYPQLLRNLEQFRAQMNGDLLCIPAMIILLALNRLFSRQEPSQKKKTVVSEGRQRSADWLDEELKKPELTVLFGSQTGTAEGYARNLGREAKNIGFRVKVEDLFNYDPASIPSETFVVFVMATYGEGEPTDSAKDFVDWMNDSSRCEDLSKLRYAVFGLGDSQYKHFCQMGKDVDARMVELGAQRLCELGLGDADQNMEEDFDNWRGSLWAQASTVFGVTPKDEFAQKPECALQVKQHDAPGEGLLPYPKVVSTALAPSQKLPCWGTVARNDEMLKLRAVEGRSTRQIEIDVAGTALAQENGYEGGDHLGVLPANADAVVAAYGRALQLSDKELDTVITLVAADGSSARNNLPSRVTVRTALKWYFDLQGVPKKAVLRAFTHFTQDRAEREEFRSLLRVSHESAMRYREVVTELRTVVGFLEKFPSTKVPLAVFMEMMPRTQPRWYSIASDALFSPQTGRIHICLAVTPGGLASTFLGKTAVGDSVPVFVRKSTFHLPQREKRRPAIMIGPGTGVAPLIGFLYRRKAWRSKWHELGECHFYFGCRARNDDWLYQELQEECLKEGVITKLRTAFSRDGPQKVYVQHHLRDDASDIWRLLQANAIIYVCGDAKRMARDVDECLAAICEGCGGMSREQAARYLAAKEKKGEYLKDVWTS
eukprot:TRINITY_DN32185_c0_g1_i1.p1 TRINITY_DN32185_c0_g1~~TRINITY_DN32185_c0_g1_i1.p1  ORF type:complete len:689 (+),score=226.45 TRINITY_DN32185_c0_g1_i1:67-2133(+)